MTAPTVQELNQRIQGKHAGALGVEILEVSAQHAVSRLAVRPDQLNTLGTLHAAVAVAIADTTCGAGTLAGLPEGARGFATLELKSNFVGSASAGSIRCEARLRHAGRTTQIWDAVVKSEQTGKNLALFGCTQLLLYP